MSSTANIFKSFAKNAPLNMENIQQQIDQIAQSDQPPSMKQLASLCASSPTPMGQLLSKVFQFADFIHKSGGGDNTIDALKSSSEEAKQKKQQERGMTPSDNLSPQRDQQLQDDYKRLQQQANDANEKMTNTDARLKLQETEVNNARKLLNDKEMEYKGLESTVINEKAKLAALEEKVATLKADLENAQRTSPRNEAREKEISKDLESNFEKVGAAKSDVKTSESKATDKEKEIVEAKKDLTEKEKKLDETKKEFNTDKDHLTKSKGELDTFTNKNADKLGLGQRPDQAETKNAENLERSTPRSSMQNKP